MNKKVLLILAGLLIAVGLLKPDLSRLGIGGGKPDNDRIVVVTPPSDQKLKDACQYVIDSLRSGDRSRSKDGVRLSELYLDIARLIELDGEDLVIRNTEEIRQANSLAGPMLRMNIKDKYPNLAKAAQNVIVVGIGDDSVPLDSDLRAKAVESFRALGWACYEGSK